MTSLLGAFGSLRGRLREVPLGAGLVVQQLVQLFPALHPSNEILLASFGLEIGEELVDGLHRNSQGRHRVDHAIVAVFLEVVDVDEGRLAELGHIGQQQYFGIVFSELLCDGLEFLTCVESFGENHVGSGIHVGNGPLDALIEPVHTLGVGPSTDDKLPIGNLQAGFSSNSDLLGHVLHRDEFLAE